MGAASIPAPPDALQVRPERPADHAAVEALVTAAFGREDEARLVRALRVDCAETHVSLVATLPAAAGSEIVAHVLFSPVQVDGRPSPGALGLAPMAVLPARQRRGIGSALLAASLEYVRERGARWVVLVGHPAFYRRAGFRPGREWGLRCEFPVPDEAFLVLELVPGALTGTSGTVSYPPRFRELD